MAGQDLTGSSPLQRSSQDSAATYKQKSPHPSDVIPEAAVVIPKAAVVIPETVEEMKSAGHQGLYPMAIVNAYDASQLDHLHVDPQETKANPPLQNQAAIRIQAHARGRRSREQAKIATPEKFRDSLVAYLTSSPRAHKKLLQHHEQSTVTPFSGLGCIARAIDELGGPDPITHLPAYHFPSQLKLTDEFQSACEAGARSQEEITRISREMMQFSMNVLFAPSPTRITLNNLYRKKLSINADIMAALQQHHPEWSALYSTAESKIIIQANLISSIYVNLLTNYFIGPATDIQANQDLLGEPNCYLDGYRSLQDFAVQIACGKAPQHACRWMEDSTLFDIGLTGYFKGGRHLQKQIKIFKKYQASGESVGQQLLRLKDMERTGRYLQRHVSMGPRNCSTMRKLQIHIKDSIKCLRAQSSHQRNRLDQVPVASQQRWQAHQQDVIELYSVLQQLTRDLKKSRYWHISHYSSKYNEVLSQLEESFGTAIYAELLPLRKPVSQSTANKLMQHGGTFINNIIFSGVTAKCLHSEHPKSLEGLHQIIALKKGKGRSSLMTQVHEFDAIMGRCIKTQESMDSDPVSADHQGHHTAFSALRKNLHDNAGCTVVNMDSSKDDFAPKLSARVKTLHASSTIRKLDPDNIQLIVTQQAKINALLSCKTRDLLDLRGDHTQSARAFQALLQNQLGSLQKLQQQLVRKKSRHRYMSPVCQLIDMTQTLSIRLNRLIIKSQTCSKLTPPDKARITTQLQDLAMLKRLLEKHSEKSESIGTALTITRRRLKNVQSHHLKGKIITSRGGTAYEMIASNLSQYLNTANGRVARIIRLKERVAQLQERVSHPSNTCSYHELYVLADDIFTAMADKSLASQSPSVAVRQRGLLRKDLMSVDVDKIEMTQISPTHSE